MTRQPTRTKTLTPFCLVFLSGSALAQQAVIEHCKQTSSDADRIACLEAALLGKPAQGPEVLPVSAEPVPAVAPVPATEPESTATSRAVAATEVAVAVEPEGIGAEQVAAQTMSLEEREKMLESAHGMVITKYEWVPYERLVVTFDNGQVWRQIKGDVNRIRTSLERNQTADITETGLGGYQLRLNEIRRTIRVERIR